MNTQRLEDHRHALAVRRAHPTADISLDSLAVRTHRSVPSSPLMDEKDGLERGHLSW